MGSLKIAAAGIVHETNSFAPGMTRLESFQGEHGGVTGPLRRDPHLNGWVLHAAEASGINEPRMNQPNDIAITQDGFLFASDPNWQDKTGNLWRIAPDGTVTLLEAGMGTTNGIEVSPDETVLYVNETAQRKIWAYDLNERKEIGGKRLFHEFADYMLDGMRCDMAGNLYVARFGKGTIAVLSPQGEQVAEVKLEGKDCTNVTFGGPDGRRVYVTVSDLGNVQMFTADHPGRCWSMLR